MFTIPAPFKVHAVHTPNPEKAGAPHNPAYDSPRTHLLTVLPATIDGDHTHGIATVRPRCFPADLADVCPNMEAHLILTATAATEIVDPYTERTYKVRKGEKVAVLNIPTATLAAWKASRTTTYGGGPLRHNRDANTARAPQPTNPRQSAAAASAWTFRAATIHGEPAVGRGREYSTGADAATALATALAHLAGHAAA